MVIGLLLENRELEKWNSTEIITRALSTIDEVERRRAETEGRETREAGRDDAERRDRLVSDIMRHVARGGK